MSFSANCISCHMCQNICFWIVHFCWEFLSEFPKQWYLLRHLFISVQFIRLGEPTCVCFCNSVLLFCILIVLLTSCVNTMHCVFQQCELLCICADIPWNLCTLPGWVSSIADRHQEGGKAWNQLLRFLTHHPHRIVEGNRATFKSDSSSATKNLLDKAVSLLVQQVQPVFFAAFTLSPPPPPSTSWLWVQVCCLARQGWPRGTATTNVGNQATDRPAYWPICQNPGNAAICNCPQSLHDVFV